MNTNDESKIRESKIRESKIRESKIQDIDKIKLLINYTIDICYIHNYPGLAIEFFKKHQSIKNIIEDSGHGYTIVIEYKNEIIATGTLLGSVIKRVFVSPEFQNKGLGKKIMNCLENRAREKRINMIELHSSIPAKKFYDSLKYLTKKSDYILLEKEQKLEFYEMYKSL